VEEEGAVEMSISVLVVLYNQLLRDIRCLGAALESGHVSQVVVCDNSTDANDNAAQAADFGVIYLPMGDNRGLSAAYNAGAAACTGDVVCVFDDDTAVGGDYFEAVASLYKSGREWDVALSLVMSGADVLSPCEFDGYRAHPFTSPLEVRESDRLSGINSGMTVKRSTFSRVRYDERLFLDLVDHRFIQDARAAGLKVVYLRGPVLRQDFSLDTDSASQAASRLQIFERDARAFYSTSPTKRAYCELMLARRKAKLCKRYGADAFQGKPDQTGKER
jgi:GT2 family glycosyltransferase